MKIIKYSTKAIKQIKKIKDKKLKKLITIKIDELKNYPDTNLIVSTYKTTDMLKFRVKNWRVFFTSKRENLIVEEVKKRNERTY